MIRFQKIGDASSRCSYVQECGGISDLDDEDILNVPEGDEISSENKVFNIQAFEDPEHTEDKTAGCWKGNDTEPSIPELNLRGTTVRADLGCKR